MSTPYDCPKCGQIHPNGCQGHIAGGVRPERKGEPCCGAPMRGGNVCYSHGGNSPQVRAASARRLATVDARKFLDRAAPNVAVDNPLELIARVTVQAAQDLAVLESLVADLADYVRLGVQGEQVRATVTLYERCLERAQRFAAEMLRLGIEDKLATVNEAIARKVLDALDAALAEVALPVEVAHRLRLVTAEGLRRAS
ncbi:MAG: hypothetical protein M3003_00905 [Candidatus Dormibacteraeota bacterium]|nr:hypothetical protein [Candidatus Dormibacteraeota bacterium]